MKQAQDRDSFDAWARWARGFPFDEWQRDTREEVYQYSLEPFAVAEAPASPRRSPAGSC
jgi:hypothetical protein